MFQWLSKFPKSWVGIIVLGLYGNLPAYDVRLEEFKLDSRSLDPVEIERISDLLIEAKNPELAGSDLGSPKDLWSDLSLRPYDRGLLLMAKGQTIWNQTHSDRETWPYFREAFISMGQSSLLAYAGPEFAQAAIFVSQLDSESTIPLSWDVELSTIIDQAISLTTDNDTLAELYYGKSILLRRLATTVQQIRNWGEALSNAVRFSDENKLNPQILFEYGQWLESFGRTDSSELGVEQNLPNPSRAVEVYISILLSDDLSPDLEKRIRRALDHLREPKLLVEKIPQFPSESNIYIPLRAKNIDSVRVEIFPYLDRGFIQEPNSSEEVLGNIDDLLVDPMPEIYDEVHTVVVVDKFEFEMTRVSLDRSFPPGRYKVLISGEGVEPQYKILNVSNLSAVAIQTKPTQFVLWVYNLQTGMSENNFSIDSEENRNVINLYSDPATELSYLELINPLEELTPFWVSKGDQFLVLELGPQDDNVFSNKKSSFYYAERPVYKPDEPIRIITIKGEPVESLYLSDTNGYNEKEVNLANDTSGLSKILKVDNNVDSGITFFRDAQDASSERSFLYFTYRFENIGKISLNGIKIRNGFLSSFSDSILQGSYLVDESTRNAFDAYIIRLYEIGKIGSQNNGTVSRYPSMDLIQSIEIPANSFSPLNFKFNLEGLNTNRIHQVQIIGKSNAVERSLTQFTYLFKVKEERDYIRISEPVSPVGKKIEFEVAIEQIGEQEEVLRDITINRKAWETEYVHRKRGQIISGSEYNSLPERSLIGSARSDYRLLNEGLVDEEIFQNGISLENDPYRFELSFDKPGYYELLFSEGEGNEILSRASFWIFDPNHASINYRNDSASFALNSSNFKAEWPVVIQTVEPGQEILLVSKFDDKVEVKKLKLKDTSEWFNLQIPTENFETMELALVSYKGGRFEIFSSMESNLSVIPDKILKPNKYTFNPQEFGAMNFSDSEKGFFFIDRTVMSPEMADLRRAKIQIDYPKMARPVLSSLISLSAESNEIFNPEELRTSEIIRREQASPVVNSFYDEIILAFPELVIKPEKSFFETTSTTTEVAMAPLEIRFQMPPLLASWKLQTVRLGDNSNNLLLSNYELSTQLPLEISFENSLNLRRGDETIVRSTLTNTSPISGTFDFSFWAGFEEELVGDKAQSRVHILPNKSSQLSLIINARKVGKLTLEARSIDFRFDYSDKTEINIINDQDHFSSSEWFSLDQKNNRLNFAEMNNENLKFFVYSNLFQVAEKLRTAPSAYPLFESEKLLSEYIDQFTIEFSEFQGISQDDSQSIPLSIEEKIDQILTEYNDSPNLLAAIFWSRLAMISPDFNNYGLEERLRELMLQEADPNVAARLLFTSSIKLAEKNNHLSRLSSRVFLNLFQSRETLNLDGIAALSALSHILEFREEVDLLKPILESKLQLFEINNGEDLIEASWALIFLNYLGEVDSDRNKLIQKILKNTSNCNLWSPATRASVLLAFYHSFQEERIRNGDLKESGNLFIGPSEQMKINLLDDPFPLIDLDNLPFEERYLRFSPISNNSVYIAVESTDSPRAEYYPDSDKDWEVRFSRSHKVETLLSGTKQLQMQWAEKDPLIVGDQLIVRIASKKNAALGSYHFYFPLPSFVDHADQIKMSVLGSEVTINKEYVQDNHLLMIEWDGPIAVGDEIVLEIPVLHPGSFVSPPLVFSNFVSMTPIVLTEGMTLKVEDH